MKKNPLPKRLSKALLLGLVLCVLAFTAACTDAADHPDPNASDLVNTASPHPGESVLDKGGADPTDNLSIINPDGTIVSETTDPLATLEPYEHTLTEDFLPEDDVTLEVPEGSGLAGEIGEDLRGTSR